METKMYLEFIGEHGSQDLEPVEDFNWTGRWKLETINDNTILYCERKFMLFNLFPIFNVWVSEYTFVTRQEEIFTNECAVEGNPLNI